LFQPLQGIKVLDLSMYLPGPLCSQILADFGAEVIKIEEIAGEWGRWVDPLIGRQSARFYSVNRNKKSAAVNLKTEKGRDVFIKLLEKTDVLIEQFRPGVMEKLGLNYDKLKKINSGLIHCAISGYGYSGPLKYTAGHDLNYLSIAGITSLTGSCSEPAMSAVQIADIGGGTLYAVIAILMALRARGVSGEGQFCDISMTDGAISLLSYTLGEWSGQGILPERGSEMLTGGYACYNIYKTRDNKFISLGAIEDKFWRNFCLRIDRPDYIQLQWAREKQKNLIDDIKAIFIEKYQQEWLDIFSDLDICLTPVLTLEEMSEHPQVKEREMLIKLPDYQNSGRDLFMAGIPIKLSSTPGELKVQFPEVGQHTMSILQKAGYNEMEIVELKEQGIIKY